MPAVVLGFSLEWERDYHNPLPSEKLHASRNPQLGVSSPRLKGSSCHPIVKIYYLPLAPFLGEVWEARWTKYSRLVPRKLLPRQLIVALAIVSTTVWKCRFIATAQNVKSADPLLCREQIFIACLRGCKERLYGEGMSGMRRGSMLWLSKLWKPFLSKAWRSLFSFATLTGTNIRLINWPLSSPVPVGED